MHDYRRMPRFESESIEAHLPEAVRTDAVTAGGLNVILSFQTWRLLRHDRELAVDPAKAVVQRFPGAALDQLPNP